MKAIFVYAPRSGSRIFSVYPTEKVVVATYVNMSCHVIGDVVEVRMQAARPGHWFRALATNFATQVVEAVGGVAYDDRGTVGCIVPQDAVPGVIERASELLPMGGNVDTASLWRQGAGKIEGEGLIFLVTQSPARARSIRVGTCWEDPDTQHVCVEVEYDGEGGGDNCIVTAPIQWGRPEIEGGLPPLLSGRSSTSRQGTPYATRARPSQKRCSRRTHPCPRMRSDKCQSIS